VIIRNSLASFLNFLKGKSYCKEKRKMKANNIKERTRNRTLKKFVSDTSQRTVPRYRLKDQRNTEPFHGIIPVLACIPFMELNLPFLCLITYNCLTRKLLTATFCSFSTLNIDALKMGIYSHTIKKYDILL
jgi:hypothetical protein